MRDWLQHHPAVLWSFVGLSALTVAGSLFVIPRLVLRLPADYFSRSAVHPRPFDGAHRARLLLVIGKNLLGALFVLLGILMLVLPGQGVLTVIAGLVMIDFPGRRRLLEWIVCRRAVLRSLNWIRRRGGKEPLVVDTVAREGNIDAA
jgi:hypothetical protein